MTFLRTLWRDVLRGYERGIQLSVARDRRQP